MDRLKVKDNKDLERDLKSNAIVNTNKSAYEMARKRARDAQAERDKLRDVTREVNNYIKKHNLQNPENKKKITPDETLRSLLKVSENDNSLTYFSMQKYLKDHFPKENTTVES